MRTGDYLGHLTAELEEFGAQSLIEEFVSVGQKTMRFVFSAPRQQNVRRNVR